MKAVHKRRLLKLAKHLKSGKLGHERFDFSLVHRNHSAKKGFCGTAGCALGECPVVFPRYWKFSDYDADLRSNSSLDSFGGAGIFFDITYEECLHLFHPEKQNPALYGGRRLGGRAKPESVANNIIAFVKKMEADHA